ncbi:hypothetical protein BJF80_08260 [Serinicoccus sp. CUA-874]|uniref:hypothetical protein n=1 Tax=Serinicoccus sp. CUA-874 TaxID=1517939 RepID=UPI0009607377|nr:hypothetical protein [Serinicoccus sp. CUA-874]OLT15946.1 hypothetical protein BJF80_08260 [Serinicoccus sp. CUA-874]
MSLSGSVDLDAAQGLGGRRERVRRRAWRTVLGGVATLGAMADLTEPCPNCGTRMRWETSHERCDGCGWIRPCCEGAPCPG